SIRTVSGENEACELRTMAAWAIRCAQVTRRAPVTGRPRDLLIVGSSTRSSRRERADSATITSATRTTAETREAAYNSEPLAIGIPTARTIAGSTRAHVGAHGRRVCAVGAVEYAHRRLPVLLRQARESDRILAVRVAYLLHS